jgi:hypothetical protein
MGLKEIVDSVLKEAPLPKHTKESDFERLKHDHRKLCQEAMEKNALILKQLRDMAQAGVLGAEFRPILLYARDAHQATEEIRIMGDDMVEQYRLAVKSAVEEIDKREKRKKESGKLKEEADELIKKHVGVETSD